MTWPGISTTSLRRPGGAHENSPAFQRWEPDRTQQTQEEIFFPLPVLEAAARDCASTEPGRFRCANRATLLGMTRKTETASRVPSFAFRVPDAPGSGFGPAEFASWSTCAITAPGNPLEKEDGRGCLRVILCGTKRDFGGIGHQRSFGARHQRNRKEVLCRES